jgi:hypothetical protein
LVGRIVCTTGTEELTKWYCVYEFDYDNPLVLYKLYVETV